MHFTALLASLLAMQIPVLWDFATIIFDALKRDGGIHSAVCVTVITYDLSERQI